LTQPFYRAPTFSSHLFLFRRPFFPPSQLSPFLFVCDCWNRTLISAHVSLPVRVPFVLFQSFCYSSFRLFRVFFPSLFCFFFSAAAGMRFPLASKFLATFASDMLKLFRFSPLLPPFSHFESCREWKSGTIFFQLFYAGLFPERTPDLFFLQRNVFR